VGGRRGNSLTWSLDASGTLTQGHGGVPLFSFPLHADHHHPQAWKWSVTVPGQVPLRQTWEVGGWGRSVSINSSTPSAWKSF
jgi:hypothetical protein